MQQQPSVPKVLIAEGKKAFQKGDKPTAQKRWGEALNAQPTDFEAIYLFGTSLIDQGFFGAAYNMLSVAADLSGGNVHEIYNNMGNALRACGRDREAEDAWREGLRVCDRVSAEDADLYNNMATVCINANRAAEAEAWAKKAIRMKPGHQQANWNLGLAYLEQGKFGEGFDQHWYGFLNGGRLNKQYDCGEWDGSPVKRLVIFGEQGQGDEVLFASMIPDALELCEELILDCHPRLEGIFQRSFNPAAIYPTRKNPRSDWIYDHRPINAKIAMGELGKLFRRKLDDFPRYHGGGGAYLKTNPAMDVALKKRVDQVANGRMTVGIAWEGGTVATHCFERTTSIDPFKELIAKHPDICWFSVHYKKDSKRQLEEAGVPVVHWQEVVDDLDGLFSLVGQMDLVIAVDQTIIHQCGAIGQPCWIATPRRCSWRFPHAIDGDALEDHMPWYGEHVRLFRQENAGEWGPVFERISEELAKLETQRANA